MHFAFVTFSSGNLVLHTFLTPSNHLVKACLHPFSPQYSTHTLFWSPASHWNAPQIQITSTRSIHYDNHPLFGTNATAHWFTPHSIHPRHFTHSPLTRLFNNIEFASLILPLPKNGLFYASRFMDGDVCAGNENGKKWINISAKTSVILYIGKGVRDVRVEDVQLRG